MHFDLRDNTVGRALLERLFHPSVLAIVLFLVLWQLVSFRFDPTVFPGLGRLVDNLIIVLTSADQFGFVENLVPSLIRIGLGFVSSMLIGVVLGTAMGVNPLFEEYLTAPVMAVMTFPAVVWAFMGVLWFGITDYGVHVMVITLVVAPYVTVNVWKGAESIETSLVEMAATFEAGWLRRWRHIYIPHLLPFIFSSSRLAFALSWKISLIAEVFGATSGVGYIVSYYFQTLRADMIIAWTVPVMILMFAVERQFRRIEERSFAWRPELDERMERR